MRSILSQSSGKFERSSCMSAIVHHSKIKSSGQFIQRVADCKFQGNRFSGAFLYAVNADVL